ncbi:YdcF family protein [Haloechinothrix sp. LS1_15]|uniref:YdcF family protein n=1 Tax=Haloechinothrix sp. LS1_15 TaxID=2652248 RepID=UPI00294473B8|nr:YdcF family protein [Haloechinothrix sp. LS1_15]MDV6012103.1 YdcF family protein [Haloechinothrix sp. LS1_15]
MVTAGTAFRVWQVARVDDRSPADAIVVLGAAQYNGSPSSIFQSRLGHAGELYHAGTAPLVVTTGGSGAGDTYTEADAGARWLREQGVPDSATLAVGVGTDTYSSLEAAVNVFDDRGVESVVIVSDPWHSLRARTMARDLGLDAHTSPTFSGPIVQTRQTQLRYIIRETGALLHYRISADPADELGGSGLG